MRDTLTLLLVQMTSTNRHAGNVEALRRRAAEAASAGCDLLALPEAAGLMNRDVEDARTIVVPDDRDPFVAAAREEAARHGIWIHTGSTPVLAPDGRFRNRTHVIDAAGEIVARYDKIHLFDVFLEGRPPSLESERYVPGEEAVLLDTPWGPWGLTICYDLRFPHLYRGFGQAGATVLFAPSAFTRPTGAAHWELLNRARAVENGAFVVSAAQTGEHDDGRKTWGHSIAVDPWGAVLADLGAPPGAVAVTLDLTQPAKRRAQVPSLKNERPYKMARPTAREQEVT